MATRTPYEYFEWGFDLQENGTGLPPNTIPAFAIDRREEQKAFISGVLLAREIERFVHD